MSAPRHPKRIVALAASTACLAGLRVSGHGRAGEGATRHGSDGRPGRVSGALAEQLVGEGRTDLDTPIETYVPDLVHGEGFEPGRITVRHLLTNFDQPKWARSRKLTSFRRLKTGPLAVLIAASKILT